MSLHHILCLLPYMPGHGYCSCGRCICQEGWFGKLCQFPRSCDMSDTQSRELCETSDGVFCSGKGDFGLLHFSRVGINLWKCRNLLFIIMLNVNNLWALEIILSHTSENTIAIPPVTLLMLTVGENDRRMEFPSTMNHLCVILWSCFLSPVSIKNTTSGPTHSRYIFKVYLWDIILCSLNVIAWVWFVVLLFSGLIKIICLIYNFCLFKPKVLFDGKEQLSRLTYLNPL